VDILAGATDPDNLGDWHSFSTSQVYSVSSLMRHDGSPIGHLWIWTVRKRFI